MRIFSPLGGASVDIDRIPSHSTIFAAIKFIKFLDILFAQLKVKHLDVGTYAIRILRLRKRNKTGHAIRYIGTTSWGKKSLTYAAQTNE
jgi:hypothetical protein